VELVPGNLDYIVCYIVTSNVAFLHLLFIYSFISGWLAFMEVLEGTLPPPNYKMFKFPLKFFFVLLFKSRLFSVNEKMLTQHIPGPITVLHWLGLGKG